MRLRESRTALSFGSISSVDGLATQILTATHDIFSRLEKCRLNAQPFKPGLMTLQTGFK